MQLTGVADELAPYAGTRIPQLVPIANRPLLAHALDSFGAAGITDVALVVSDATAEEVRAEVGDGGRWGLRSHYVEAQEPFGIAAAVLAAEEVIGRAPFLVHDGASVLGTALPQRLRRFEAERLDILLLCQAEGELHSSSSSPVSRAEEDLAAPPGVAGLDLGLVTAYVLSPTVLGAILGLRPSWRGQIELAEALERVVAEGGRTERLAVGGWRFGSRAEDLLRANRFLIDCLVAGSACRRHVESSIEGRVVVHPTARIESSIVRGPAVIGPHATVVDAYVGPYTSIGANVLVEAAEVQDSIVLEGAAITDLGRRLEASIVGKEARLSRDFSLPATLRMRVGERAEIALA